MKIVARGLILFFGLLLLWQFIVIIFQLPPYILPSPWQVLKVGYAEKNLILLEAIPTVTEALLGLLLGILFGALTAILMSFFRRVNLWMLPIMIISQAVPTFAIAPLLVMWFGYGMTSKIITTIIMLFFPVTSAFFDGLRRTDTGWLDLAKTMAATKWQVFLHIRIPAALPSLASGIRVAAVIAPIGAIVGEWVGASKGLGFLMLNANARLQIDLMFAVLFIIIIFSLCLYFIIDKSLKYLIFWER